MQNLGYFVTVKVLPLTGELPSQCVFHVISIHPFYRSPAKMCDHHSLHVLFYSSRHSLPERRSTEFTDFAMFRKCVYSSITITGKKRSRVFIVVCGYKT